MRPQIILDTNVLFAGLYSRTGAAFLVLDRIGKGLIDIHLSVPIVVEYEDVLKRDALRIGMTSADIDSAINSICAMGKHHRIYYLWRPTLADPKDDMLLELAVTSQCPFIVTHNHRHFKDAKAFGIEAVSPLQFLKKIGVCL